MNHESMRDEQWQAWNGPSASAWIDARPILDDMFAGFAEVLAREAQAVGARSVLDVGCGTGATTLALARAATAGCTGIDISAPMIAVARERAARERSPARFIDADAGSFDFGSERFDLIVSRFGVMFFPDPGEALAHLRGAAAPGAAMRCIAWRSPAENPFMTAGERAAAPLLPPQPPRDPHAPGQFAFADRERVTGLLTQAGWRNAELRPLDLECTLRTRDLHEFMTRLGPVARILREVDATTGARLVSALREGFAPFVHGEEVRYTAATWMIEARN